MQGFERMDRKLTDVAALAGHLIPAGSMFAFLAEHRAEVFPDAGYADLFAPPGFGRPSVPATQMATVMIRPCRRCMTIRTGSATADRLRRPTQQEHKSGSRRGSTRG